VHTIVIVVVVLDRERVTTVAVARDYRPRLALAHRHPRARSVGERE
jgi:hypothetical protein